VDGRRRVILHVDMDAFYVSVELRRHPELRGRPVVVGGGGPRGVVAAASYEARRYGVRSAMPGSVARRQCPHLVVLPGDHAEYGRVSAQVREVLDRYTPLVEPLALDEAFLDVSGATRLHGDGPTIARSIRTQIHDELDLECSVGVARTKFLAKLASVAAKPVARPDGVQPGSGVVEVPVDGELAFLHPLPVGRLWGVGPATLERLSRLGIRTVGDLASVDPRAVTGAVGETHGRHLLDLAAGIDDRPVVTDRELKSIGHEETFEHDLVDLADLDRTLVRMADAVASRLRRHGVVARTLTLKVRFSGFDTITRSTTGAQAVDTAPSIVAALRPILAGLDVARGVRLLGVSGTNLRAPSAQLSLLEPEHGPDREHEAASAVDAVRGRFGAGAIKPASTITRTPRDTGDEPPGAR
jgi:DNA polymerase IV